MVVSLSRNDRIAWYCIFVPACFSIAASVFTLGSYAYFRKLRTPTMRLVMLQTLAQLFFNLGYNVAFYNPPATDTAACRFQGFMLNLTLLTSILFTASIAGYVVLTIKQTRRVVLSGRNLGVVSGCIVIFSAAMAAMPFISDQYANMGPRCWIAEDEGGRNRHLGIIYRFTTHYVIIWACIIFIVYSYYSIACFFRDANAQRETAASAQNAYVRRTISVLIFYPVICFIVWMPLTIIRIFTAMDASLVIPVEVLGPALLLPSVEGLLFGIVFSQYRVVQHEWRKLLCRSRDGVGDESGTKRYENSSGASPAAHSGRCGPLPMWCGKVFPCTCCRGNAQTNKTVSSKADGSLDTSLSANTDDSKPLETPVNNAAPDRDSLALVGRISVEMSTMAYRYVASTNLFSTFAQLEMEMPEFDDDDDDDHREHQGRVEGQGQELPPVILYY